VNHPSLVLIGRSPELEGLRWESDNRLRIGRLATNVDIVVNDASVSPHHAEVVATRNGWVVRDLGSMYGTFLNGNPVNGKQELLLNHDELRFGRIILEVHLVETTEQKTSPQTKPTPPPPPPIPPIAAPPVGIRSTGSLMRVKAATQQTWEEAINAVTVGNQGPWQERHMRALLRASYSICQVAGQEELVQSVLDNAVSVLEGQRGAILLAEEETGHLRLRTLSLSRPTLRNKGTHSHTLAERCFRSGESLLCADVRAEAEILNAQSVAHGAMTSIICALLRTPRQRLGVLHIDRGPLQTPFNRDEFLLADALAATVSVGIESAQMVEKQREQFVQTIAALGRAVEIRDQYTANHTNRVTEYSLVLAKEMQLSAEQYSLLQIGTPLHDIGKIGIADAILCKPNPLTPDEYEHMKLHTLKGAAILETIPSLQSVIPIARNHHERWDGTGYPDRLAGDRITLVARIVAVADAFDAMTSDRPYRKALPLEVAFAELRDKAGTHFDPSCVKAFLNVRARIEGIHQQKNLTLGAVDLLHLSLENR
jgi:HD-GYP domain-containing protein (c-di-GMP phosphodiesterase class II)/pSer/pThr/pTyr-binding forkhead associated (FHA) protein